MIASRGLFRIKLNCRRPLVMSTIRLLVERSNRQDLTGLDRGFQDILGKFNDRASKLVYTG